MIKLVLRIFFRVQNVQGSTQIKEGTLLSKTFISNYLFIHILTSVKN